MNLNEQIKQLETIIKENDNIVFFGGAGISTESGIPDFRSKDGLYNQKDIQFEEYEPEYLLSKKCLYNNPKVFFEFYRQKMDTRNVQPNSAHYFLAKLEQMGKLKGIVTQNIDGLHQKAGSKKVVEIHGTAQVCHCTNNRCNAEYSCEDIFNSKQEIPRCPKCDSMIRPDITLYGEQLPDLNVSIAITLINNADVLIIGGTSLTVYPASSFINYFNDGKLVIINRDRIDDVDLIMGDNDLQINANIGDVFSRIVL